MPARALPRHNQATYASGALDVLLPRVSAVGFRRYRAMLRASMTEENSSVLLHPKLRRVAHDSFATLERIGRQLRYHEHVL